MKKDQFILSVLVSNIFSVLNRVSGLFARRGFNIDSLSVGETDDPKFSRMTIVATGDDYVKNQIVQQLRKLHDIQSVVLLDENSSVLREHALVKLNYSNKKDIDAFVESFKANAVFSTKDTIIIEIVDDQSVVESFIEKAKKFGILEMCRAGALALAK